MRKPPFIVAILGLAACGSDHAAMPDAPGQHDAAVDSKVWMDAPPPQYDFSCMGNAAPADGSASANVTLSGTVTEVSYDLATMMPAFTPLDGATMNACKAGAANCTGGNKLDGPVMSANGGNFSLGPIATQTNPLDGYVSMSHTGDRDTYVYPPQPVAMDLSNIPLLTFANTTFALANQAAGANQQAGNGNLILAVTDCTDTAIEGATVTVKQGGNDVPNTTDFDLGLLSSQGAGVHVIFNVPPGDTEVGATLNGMTLRAHIVHVFATSSTATIVRPGYL